MPSDPDPVAVGTHVKHPGTVRRAIWRVVPLVAVIFLTSGGGASLSSAALSQAKPLLLSVGGRSGDNVSIAASGAYVAVTWSGAATNVVDIYAALSRDGGLSFSAPVRVNSTAGDARVGGEQPPRVALVARRGGVPEIVVVWTSKGANGTRLLVSRSNDGATSFGASEVVPGGEGVGNRGWESVAVDAGGRVHVMWLDHRETMAAGAMHHQESDATTPKPKADPVEKAGKSQLYVSSLDAKGGRSIARGVCYCCKTSLVSVGDQLFAAWRHVFPGNERDIAFTHSRDGGRTFASPVRVSDDHWQFDGCPENGPAVAVDRARRAHVLWLTPLDGKEGAPLVLYHAVSRDGRSFAPRVRIATGRAPGHVQATVAPDGSIVSAWDEITDRGRRIMFARGTLSANGDATFAALASPEVGEAHHPVVATASSGVVAAWVKKSDEGNVIAVARVPLAVR